MIKNDFNDKKLDNKQMNLTSALQKLPDCGITDRRI